MKNTILVFAIMLFSITTSNAQSWVEYQLNSQHVDSTTQNSHTLDAFMVGKANAKGFSVNGFCLTTKGWGEVLVLPSWSKSGKAGFLSLSLGGGVETATKSPRLAASAFYKKRNFESLFFWEQGTNIATNSWHLGYATYKLNIDERFYSSIGLHSQKGATHGIRVDFGQNDKWKLWMVFGKHRATKGATSALIGLRYLL